MRNDNIVMKNNILTGLARVEYTSVYAFAIREDQMVKAVVVEDANDILPLITICERQAKSHGSDWGVRIHGTKKNFALMKEYAREVVDICSVDCFEEIYATEGNRGSNNRGHIFEKLCAERMGGYQVEKKNAKCTESGDIVVNGEHIQCKLWNATVTTEKQVMRFMAQINN